MRSVSLVSRLELKVPGNVLANALCLGDVDNDGGNELLVGNVSGSLMVFKGLTSRHPVCSAEGLGLITCMGAGDIFMRNQNHVVCVNAEGQLYAFDVKIPPTGSDVDKDKTMNLQPMFQQRLPPNTRVLLLADLGEDDSCTLVLGFTDRMVRAYRWIDSGQAAESADEITGNFIQMDAWSFDGQVGSLSVTQSAQSRPLLVVSQPGGQYVTLDCSHWRNRHKAESVSTENQTVPSSVYTLVQSKHHPEAPTEVIGNVRRAGSTDPTDLIAMATLNGSIKLLSKNSVQWQLHVGHHLFSLTKMDVTVDGLSHLNGGGVQSWPLTTVS